MYTSLKKKNKRKKKIITNAYKQMQILTQRVAYERIRNPYPHIVADHCILHYLYPNRNTVNP